MQQNFDSQSFSCQSLDLKNLQKTHTDENSLSFQASESQFSQTSRSEKPIQMCKRQKQLPCLLCGSVFFRINHFMQHMLMHREKEPLLCGMCGKAFSYYYSLREHVKVHVDRNDILVKIVD